jgi:hypothetical protein
MSSSNLGGPYTGFSAKQTVNNYKDASQTATRSILRRAWNNTNVNEKINGYGRITTPFRAVNNLGDYLSRQNYVCGGSVENNPRWIPGGRKSLGRVISHCDSTGVAAYSGNQRFVPDSSDYITFKRQMAMGKVYNDLSAGGDQHNASYVALKSNV